MKFTSTDVKSENLHATAWADVKNSMPLCEKKMPLSDAIMFEKTEKIDTKNNLQSKNLQERKWRIRYSIRH